MKNQPKIFYMGKQIQPKRTAHGRFTSLKTRANKVVRVLKYATVAGTALALATGYGALAFSSSTVVADTQVITVNPAQPVLDRIADCESGNGKQGTATQYAKSGQVLVKPNKNGTVDMGKYQINSVWFAKATELGLDLTKESDNKAMAQWIYANKGTGDWSASAHCWNK